MLVCQNFFGALYQHNRIQIGRYIYNNNMLTHSHTHPPTTVFPTGSGVNLWTNMHIEKTTHVKRLEFEKDSRL